MEIKRERDAARAVGVSAAARAAAAATRAARSRAAARSTALEAATGAKAAAAVAAAPVDVMAPGGGAFDSPDDGKPLAVTRPDARGTKRGAEPGPPLPLPLPHEQEQKQSHAGSCGGADGRDGAPKQQQQQRQPSADGVQLHGGSPQDLALQLAPPWKRQPQQDSQGPHSASLEGRTTAPEAQEHRKQEEEVEASEVEETDEEAEQVLVWVRQSA